MRTKAALVLGASAIATTATCAIFYAALFVSEEFIALPYSQSHEAVVSLLPICVLLLTAVVRFMQWRSKEARVPVAPD